MAAVTAARVVYLAWLCPYALAEDEAHYWEWSRHPAWSYYSKGPGVAWAVAASTRMLGTSEFAVRLPAALFGGIAALAVAGLARAALGDRRAGFFAAAAFLLTPLGQMTGILMTIDGPFLACWALAAWAGWHALARGSGPAWAALGAAVGAGFLFKYTIVLLPPGLALFAAVSRPRPRRVGAAWVAAGVLAAAAGLLPVAVWNAHHDWATVRHLLGHLGVRGGDMPAAGAGERWSPWWAPALVGSQLGFLGVPTLLIVLGAIEAFRRRDDRPGPGGRRRPGTGEAYLLCAAAPILAFYLGVALMAEPEGNWPVGAHVTLLALAGGAAVAGLDEHRRRAAAAAVAAAARPRTTLRRAAWRASVVAGVAVGLGLLRLDLLARLPVLGPLIPIGRLTSARPVAASTQRVLERLRAEGEDPFVVAQHYGRAGQLAFYLPGRPPVYCSSSRLGGRRTQHDYWPDTDLDDLGRLAGRAAVLLGATAQEWDDAFQRVEPLGTLAGDHKKDRLAFVGYGYRGFPGSAANPRRNR